HRQAREADAQARTRRLVHLAEDGHGVVDDARHLAFGRLVLGLAHLEPQVVALARALADAAEDAEAALLDGRDPDQLLDEHGLADAGAAEQADLAALRERTEEVDDLEAGLEHF